MLSFPRRATLALGLPLLLAACAAEPADYDLAASPAWLRDRAAPERAMLARTPVEHDFRFRDRLAESGITFVNGIVDDAGRSYRPVHYDHGTGVAAADVDGDGRTDLYFVAQRGGSELWRNLGEGRFADVTDSSGLALPGAIAVGASFADIDNDGDPDLFVTTVRQGNRLFENVGGGRFRDISVAAGVHYAGHSSGAVFFDYDRDGLLDLLVTNVGVYTTHVQGRGGYYVGVDDAFFGHTVPGREERSILYRNLGGNRFADVTSRTGLVDASWSGDATPLDANDDGFTDLLMLNMQGQNHLWINAGGQRFRDSTFAYFPRTPFGAMGVKVFDFDGDARLDVLITDMHSDMFDMLAPGDWAGEARKSELRLMPPALFPAGTEKLMFGNALFANRGRAAGGYREVSDSLGLENYWPWGPSVDDLNADGWDDVFIASSMNFPFRYAINSLFLNDRGRRFLPGSFTLGVEPRAGGVTEQPWFTLACEPGGLDAGSRGCQVCTGPEAEANGCRRDSAGTLTMMAARGTRSSVILDLDGDGDLDLVTNEYNAAPRILTSDLAATGPVGALTVRLRGTRSNRQGLGATVILGLEEGQHIVKALDGKSGYLSQSDLPLYFGFGTAIPRRIVVVWPSGQRQEVVDGLRAGADLTIIEP